MDEFNNDLLEKFVEIKTLEGLSENTLYAYKGQIKNFLTFYTGPLTHVTSDDIKEYLFYKQDECECSKVTLDNTRRFLHTFFRTLTLEGLIKSNPVQKVPTIKTEKRLKKPFTNIEIIHMRDSIDSLRDKAIFELLLSSGVRVSECSNIKVNDLNFKENSFYVIGKGNKERKVYFSDEAKVAIQKYLTTRSDDNPALFVSINSPYNKLDKGAIENIIRRIGEGVGVKAHPHKFRRTMASNALKRGVPIEHVQKLLGHNSIDTTTIYAITDDSQVNHAHKKYIE